MTRELNEEGKFMIEYDGRTFVMTRTVIQIARCFNYFYLAELCKLTVEEMMGKIAAPLLKCIEYDQWHMALPAPYKTKNHVDLDLKPLSGSEWLFVPSVSVKTVHSKEKENMKLTWCTSSEANKQYRPITTATIQLSTILHQWLSTDIRDYQPDSAMFQTLKSVEKIRQQQQAIIETRQLQAIFHSTNNNNNNNNNNNTKTIKNIKTSTTTTRSSKKASTEKAFPCTENNKRKRVYFHYNHVLKKSKLLEEKERILPLPSQQPDHNLHLLASQATQMRGLPISPSIAPSSPTPFLLQPIDNQTKQPPLRLPSIQSMLSELSIPIGGRNMDSCRITP
ncbi:hypothetical protein AB4K20DRAFT_1986589 [Rhizopus microsporus]|uniref:Uncharacterized protein n=1 Tax=Rhizopus microsporus TaxID=58291 RepID=A0A1X0RV75_RHIZD|nr:hypothetical protein BCV71DRAFT_257123 [Rhizopus microsporus]